MRSFEEAERRAMTERFSLFVFGLLFLGAYFLGSIPWGVVFARLFSGQDIRHQGSGNIGATNVGRSIGLLPGLLTLSLDVAKGALPVFLAVVFSRNVTGGGDLFAGLVALAALMGHLYPCFLGFKGGKGVATAAGCFSVLAPMALAVSVVVFLAVAIVSRRVSAGSVGAAAALPPAVWLTGQSGIVTGCAGIAALFIIFRHRENIRRIVSGAEPEFKFKKSSNGP